MVEPSISGKQAPKRAKQGQESDLTYLAVTLAGTLLLMGFLYYLELSNLPVRQLYRYLTLIPVSFLAYQYGMKAGMLSALFFSTAFLPQLYWTLTRGQFLAPQSIQVIAYVIFVNAFAYIIADIAKSYRTHEALSSAVRDWGALLSRSSALDEVIKFILEQARVICRAENSVFLLRNPLDAQWEIITLQEKIPLPLSGSTQREHQNLAEWLLDQEKELVLNNLDKKPSFIVPFADLAPEDLWSLLAQPLRHRDGTLMGLLVLLNKDEGDFTKADLLAMNDLIAGGERALEQAGLYARTDYALARRVRQLAAIQRTARELNATLDPKQIIERTLECALEITDGEAGFISLDMKGFPPIFQTYGAGMDANRAPLLAEKARELERTITLPLDASGIPPLLPQASSRLLAPIKRENQTLGLVIVESSSPRIFKEASRHVLTILADHAAIALENARLFQEIQMEQQRVSLIIHSIADGLFTTDFNGIIKTFNPAAEKLTGWPAGEVIGHRSCEVFGCPNWDAPDHECSMVLALKQQMGADEDKYVIRQRSGTKRVILLSMTPLPVTNDRPAGTVFLFRDVTEQEEMDRLQRELIAAISHELRAPLSHISTITETLMAEADQAAFKPYFKHLNTLVAQTHRLADFSDRILDVYRLETGQLRLQLRPLPVCLLVEELVKNWQMSASPHSFVANLPKKSPWIWADENGFKTVLNNLLDNAAKYSPANSTIEVVVKEAPKGYVTCGVKDQGPGVEPDFQTKIFQRFYRVDGRDAQSIYGHGLGLYIAKNLIDEMKGQIWVESEVGKGSFFAFYLPIMEEFYEGEDLSHR